MSSFVLRRVYIAVTLRQCLVSYCAVSYGIKPHFESYLTAIPLFGTQDTDADSAAYPFCSPRTEHVAEIMQYCGQQCRHHVAPPSGWS